MSRLLRKVIFISSLIFVCTISQAQINLDQPIPVGPSDLCFKSAEAGQAYCFQKQLCRIGEENWVNAQGQWQVHFIVGSCKNTLLELENRVKAVNPTIKMVRTLRASKATVTGSRLLAVPSIYEPEVHSTGDFLDLYGPTPYVFTANHWNKRRYKRYSESAIDQVFHDSNFDYLGSVEYEFLAIKEGKLGTSTTSIPIYATPGKELVGNAEEKVVEFIFTRFNI